MTSVVAVLQWLHMCEEVDERRRGESEHTVIRGLDLGRAMTTQFAQGRIRGYTTCSDYAAFFFCASLSAAKFKIELAKEMSRTETLSSCSLLNVARSQRDLLSAGRASPARLPA